MSRLGIDHFRHRSWTQRFPSVERSDGEVNPTFNNSASTGTRILPVSKRKCSLFSGGISLRERESDAQIHRTKFEWLTLMFVLNEEESMVEMMGKMTRIEYRWDHLGLDYSSMNNYKINTLEYSSMKNSYSIANQHKERGQVQEKIRGKNCFSTNNYRNRSNDRVMVA